MGKRFKGLDTLRFLAAIIVVLGHIEQLKNINNIPRIFEKIPLPSGHISVILFFVISGFLITFLLVKEKEKNGTISLKRFYQNRILRIWPLYYLILILSFLLINVNYNTLSIILCSTIFPNVAHALRIGWPSSPQIWSIGVEEQFYLIWPLVISFVPAKRIIMLLILFFIGYSLLPHLIGFINIRTINNENLSIISNRFFYGTKFNCMAVGALLGYLYAKKHNSLQYLYNTKIAYLCIILSFSLWFLGVNFKYFTFEIYSILFGISILNLTTNNNLKFNIDFKPFVFLGKISYGIYMYHWLIILLVFKLIPHKQGENLIYFNFVLYFTALTLTIFISWISHISFEKYFLSLKK